MNSRNKRLDNVKALDKRLDKFVPASIEFLDCTFFKIKQTTELTRRKGLVKPGSGKLAPSWEKYFTEFFLQRGHFVTLNGI